MPKNNEPSGEELKKAGIVVGITNLLLWPFYYADSRWGLFASIFATSAVLYASHEVGEGKRPVENSVARLGLFQQHGTSNAEIENAFNNTVTGAAAIYDWLVPGSNGPK
ncbi:hypothetical protein [Legionella pneumophila]|uniref:hypothetical protein n=1 Tax=Legionella pneumophila TaxID=446 RepID=UPI000480B3AA|nr:hypothetical protein [Legionella pneumophila]CZH12351.1 Uncharacterised protein [Legionella pneumophila]CZI15117.1 Uncharacterised protein [Legionella pneumophila]CZK00877.1 Uncharacterised protein [Legionella pneumophila]CZR11595.1 Uncharacterised protein [Legionella pneumophila]STX67767.1 Uncharacterised protein [Legionella pneumophila]